MTGQLISEPEVRALRDTCFGDTCTDENWAACRQPGGEHGKGWLHPDNIAWLQAHQRHLPYTVRPKPKA